MTTDDSLRGRTFRMDSAGDFERNHLLIHFYRMGTGTLILTARLAFPDIFTLEDDAGNEILDVPMRTEAHAMVTDYFDGQLAYIVGILHTSGQSIASAAEVYAHMRKLKALYQRDLRRAADLDRELILIHTALRAMGQTAVGEWMQRRDTQRGAHDVFETTTAHTLPHGDFAEVLADHDARTLTLRFYEVIAEDWLCAVRFTSPYHFSIIDRQGEEVKNRELRAELLTLVYQYYTQEGWDRISAELVADDLSISWMQIITSDHDNFGTNVGADISDTVASHPDGAVVVMIIFKMLVEDAIKRAQVKTTEQRGA